MSEDARRIVIDEDAPEPRPSPTDEGTNRRARLAGTLGHSDFTALLRGFRAQLAEALEAFDQKDIADRAHRIAGLAGTLGFPEVSATWIALSEGDVSHRDRDRARIAARQALGAIDRWVADGIGG